MSDKDRIEKLIQTLMQVKNVLTLIQNKWGEPELDNDIDTLKDTIEHVIQQNADHLKLDL